MKPENKQFGCPELVVTALFLIGCRAGLSLFTVSANLAFIAQKERNNVCDFLLR